MGKLCEGFYTDTGLFIEKESGETRRSCLFTGSRLQINVIDLIQYIKHIFILLSFNN